MKEHHYTVDHAQVSGGDIVFSNERLLSVDNFVDSQVRVEVGLNVLKDNHGTVGTATTKM